MQENINIPDSNITTNLTFRQLVLMNMQQLTNFPYIEQDFDALTDYELLCLVVKFLNDVIDNQNEQNDSITRMYQSFLELQTYVNNTKDTLEDAFNNLDDYVRNYFDNLDVQEEINNKLDQMLEDGVLEQIIEQFIQSTAVWCFDTVADMKQATNLINGSFAQTLGYYSVNDGGGATYKITSTESQTDYQEELNTGLYATLIIGDCVFPEMFGSKSDGETDDTTIIQYLLNNYDYVVLSKEYLVTNLNVNKNLNLKINKLNGNITLKNSGVNLEFNIINGSIIVEDDEHLVQKCNVKGYKIINESGNGIYLHSTSNGIQYNHFDILVIRANKCVCFNKTAGWINNNFFKNMTFSYNVGIDVLTTGTTYDGNSFHNVSFEDINKWFNLNGFWNTVIDNPRMIPFEAHQEEIQPSTKLGSVANCYNLTLNGLTNGIFCDYIEITSGWDITVINPLTSGGTRIGNHGMWNGTKYTNLSQSIFTNPYLKLSEISGSTLQINLGSYDLTKPININLDTNKYLYININTSNDLKDSITDLAIPYIDFNFIGSQTSTIDVAYRNSVKHTVQANVSDDTFRYYFGS